MLGKQKCKILKEIREKYEADERIMAVTGLINALPEASLVTEADAPAIQEARALYDALPSDAKSLVENLSRLSEAEAALKAIRLSLFRRRKYRTPKSAALKKSESAKAKAASTMTTIISAVVITVKMIVFRKYLASGTAEKASA